MTTPPEWIERFVDRVATSIQPVDMLAPLGCHFHEADSTWEISLFASITEVVGGEKDGERIPSRFFVDVERLREVFTQIADTTWQALPIADDDEAGSHISVEGLFEGHRIWLRILSQPPDRFGVGRIADVRSTSIREDW